MDVDELLGWYERVRRPLPWRATRDPYALLVSEVMLQQTQALRVVPYYERVARRVARRCGRSRRRRRGTCSSLWSGLGYNRRALALQRAAVHVSEHGWPSDLTVLPGVGPYTAAAVASFAWDMQVAAVDTNVRRVLTRRDGLARSPGELAAAAQALVPPGRAATFNQAMMELGATVCRPRNPSCPACPVSRGCARVIESPAKRTGAPRFEDTDRYARGRVVAALLAGEEPVLRRPPRARPRRPERDGLIVFEPDGRPTPAMNQRPDAAESYPERSWIAT